MKNLLLFACVLLSGLPLVFAADAPAPNGKPRILVLPEQLIDEDEALQKLSVTVECGYISEIRKIPELWNIRMGFDMPSVQLFEATVRLGAAAKPKLGGWSRSLRIANWESDCFSVKVVATGRDHEYVWQKAGFYPVFTDGWVRVRNC